MYTSNVPIFSDFLLQKLQEFERSKGRRITQEEFADFLGVNRISISYWLSGRNKPSPENAKLLADKLGLEIYDTLDLPRPDPDLHYLQAHWVNLPPEKRKAIREIAEKYETKK